MQHVNNLLDKVKECCSIPSDNALSKKIGITRALVSGWRVGRYPVPDERIAQLCNMAKLDAPEWVARLHEERAQSAVERAMWSKMLMRLAAAAIFVAPYVAGATEKAPEIKGFAKENSAVCILCSKEFYERSEGSLWLGAFVSQRAPRLRAGTAAVCIRFLRSPHQNSSCRHSQGLVCSTLPILCEAHALKDDIFRHWRGSFIPGRVDACSPV